MLNDRHLLVVGAGPGIGAAVARRFGGEGYRITLAARDRARLDRLAADTTGPGGRAAEALVLDAADPTGLAGALRSWVERTGTPDVVVYNAATLQRNRLSGLPPVDLARTLDTDVVGAVAAVQAVLPAMRAAGRGTILLTGGGLALAPSPDHGSLSVGKAALRAAALVLGEELGGVGVHVATVTVAAFVVPGTAADPGLVAEQFWDLAQEPRTAWRHEIVFPVAS